MTDADRSSAIVGDRRETILRREAATHPDPRSRTVFETLADRLAQARRSTMPGTLPTDQRRALLVSAAVLMDQALRLLGEGGSSLFGVWLTHAIECLNVQLDRLD